jgi:hypothetical protein
LSKYGTFIQNFFPSKIWGTLADLVMSHTWIGFLLPSGKNSDKIKKAVNIESQDESQRLETSLAA